MNLRELARSLNLSQTTVSRALNGYPEVREATRARVLAAARAAEYRPDTRARRLATGRAMAIGHVIAPQGAREMVNPIFADFMGGAGEIYAQAGYDLLVSVAGPDGSEAAYRRMATSASVDAVLVQGPQVDDPRIALLQELGLPFVVHGRAGAARDYSFLDIANTQAFRQASEHLLERGHRRIALINGPESFDFARRRRAGYEAALRACGIDPEPALMRADVMTEGYGYRAAMDLLDGARPPSAFVVASVIPAMGVQRAVTERGMRLGREVSLVCHDDALSYLANDAGGPDFTATRSSIRAAGRRCAEILLARIEAPDAPPVQELWEAPLIPGHSTGPAMEAVAGARVLRAPCPRAEADIGADPN